MLDVLVFLVLLELLVVLDVLGILGVLVELGWLSVLLVTVRKSLKVMYFFSSLIRPHALPS